jgi:hypothetical protein
MEIVLKYFGVLMHIGKSAGHGSTKTAYTLKDHPDLLFLQLDKWRDDERSVGQLKNEIEWINKLIWMLIKFL